FVEDVAERKHRHPMRDLAERLHGRGTDTHRRAILAHELWKPRLDRIVPRAQGIVVRIRDFRRGVLVIERIVVGDLAGEIFELRGGFRLVQAFDRDYVRRRRRPLAARRLELAHADLVIRRSAAALASSVTVWPASMRAISSRRLSPSSRTTRVA